MIVRLQSTLTMAKPRSHMICIGACRPGLMLTMPTSNDGHCYSFFTNAGKSMKHAAFNEEWIAEGD